MSDTKPAITFDDIVELMDKKYNLYYVDYRDDLSERLQDVQDAIHGNPEGLDSIFYDWDVWETEKYYLDELEKEVARHFDIDDEEAEALIEEHQDDLRNVLWELDESTPLKDLIRNTGDQIFFYDTGMYIEDYTSDLKERIKDCKRALKIPIKNKEHDKYLEEMCCNASYGGRLVVYFRDGLEDWIHLKEDANMIHFSGMVTVAVIDNGNGSGGDTAIKHSFSLPFNRENIFLDRCIKYSYTYDVCGMCGDWCDGTEVKVLTKKTKKKIDKSNINDYLGKEKKLDEVYRNGGCTPGDMRYNRHRNVTYINNFPCGNKCLDCGTFWID